jgi:hypothetical protein
MIGMCSVTELPTKAIPIMLTVRWVRSIPRVSDGHHPRRRRMSAMRGLICAGGTASRLEELTRVTDVLLVTEKQDCGKHWGELAEVGHLIDKTGVNKLND